MFNLAALPLPPPFPGRNGTLANAHGTAHTCDAPAGASCGAPPPRRTRRRSTRRPQSRCRRRSAHTAGPRPWPLLLLMMMMPLLSLKCAAHSAQRRGAARRAAAAAPRAHAPSARGPLAAACCCAAGKAQVDNSIAMRATCRALRCCWCGAGRCWSWWQLAMQIERSQKSGDKSVSTRLLLLKSKYLSTRNANAIDFVKHTLRLRAQQSRPASNKVVKRSASSPSLIGWRATTPLMRS